ncbi:MAG: class A beta-lactamase-related serine hydrolase [Rhodobacteraceae bacterium]|nr:MAG: class A beta-lactamase-related serine hydrolase [Paracoccaceae bacterium]
MTSLLTLFSDRMECGLERLRSATWAVLFVGITQILPANAEESAIHELGARFDALAEAFMTTQQVPGAIGALVLGDEVILRGWGYSDIEAGTSAGPDDVRFEIGSISKLFTWLGVMMLVEEGALDLQADVSGYLVEATVPGEEPLTLAQLMSHRPGFEDSYALFDPDTGALPRPQALAASAPDQVFPRGAVTAYSNWGVALAGQIIEDVAGIPFEEFVQARILDPLGMVDTTYSEAMSRPDQPPLSRSYRVQGGINHPAFRVDIGSFGPAGSFASTAADMGRFLRFLLSDGAIDGTRLFSPATIAQMRTRLFDDLDGASDMVHGFQARPLFGTVAFGHAGGLNEFLSNLVFIPELGAGVFISQNGGTGASLPFLVPDLILAHLAAEAGLSDSAPQPVPDASARAEEVAGRYLANRREFSGPLQAMAPQISVQAQPDGAIHAPSMRVGTMVRHDPIDPDLWQGPDGERIMAIRDDAGRVVRLMDGSGSMTYERIRFGNDPMLAVTGFGLSALLALTTLLGLIWRHGLKGGSRMGTLVTSLGVVASVLVWMLVAASGLALATALQLGMEYMIDQPQPTLVAVFVLADVLAVLALILLVLLILWRGRGWSLGRRLHHFAFVMVLTVTAALFGHWGLAFGGFD